MCRYCGEFDNAAAMMIVNKDLMVSFKVGPKFFMQMRICPTPLLSSVKVLTWDKTKA